MSYLGFKQRRTFRYGGDCAADLPVDAHRGNHWDFLCRYQRAAETAARGTRHERREFARRPLMLGTDPRNLMCAIEYVAWQDKCPGPNNLRVRELTKSERWELAQVLGQAILNGTYRRGQVRRVRIPKSSGNGTRPIEILNDDDKVVARAVLQVLQPIVDPNFDERSFLFRPGLGREHALVCGESLAREMDHWTWITEDFANAFTQVPHGRLLDVLRRHALDDGMLALVRHVIANRRNRGLPQGSPLSPFLMNVYCDHFVDRPWRDRHPQAPLIRGADDLLLLAAGRAEAETAYADLERLVAPAGLPLKGCPRDSIRHICYGQHADWLGYHVKRTDQGIKVQLGPKSWNQLHERLARCHAEPQAALRAREIIRGWVDQLGACYPHEDRRDVYNQAASTAREFAYEEIPTWEEFSDIWEKAHIRFYHLRRVVLLQMHGRLDRSLSPTGRRPNLLASRSESLGRFQARSRPRVTIYTDGSCLGSRGIGGWAFVIEGPARGQRLCRANSCRRATNSRMELVAVARALEALTEPTRIHLVTDSQYVLRGIERLPRWRQNRWRGVGSGGLAHVRLWQQVDGLLARHDVTCQWVRGHSGHAGNEQADQLARDAAMGHA